MFLHLVDDEKFIAKAIEIFNRMDPGNHLFVRIVGPIYNPTKHICYVQGVIEIEFNSSQYTELIRDLKKYTAVFIHNLINVYHVHVVNAASPNAVLVWLFWGAEIWMIPRFRNRILLPQTKILYYKNKIVPWVQRNLKKYLSIIGPDRSQFTYFRNKKSLSLSSSLDLERAIKKVDFIVPVYEDDFYLLQQIIPCKAKRLEWYYPPPRPFEALESLTIEGENWVTGNSAHYSNNHLELFQQLRKIPGHTGKVIVPLSYGDNRYQADVLRFGCRLLGDRFMPLTEFLSYDLYMKMLSSCTAAFFNSCRQQAMGSIFPLLYLGVRVFLREENPVYRFLIRNEIVVFSIPKDIPKSAKKLGIPLSEQQIKKNRDSINAFAGKGALEDKTKILLDRLTLHRAEPK
jgi:hypothetical protein